MSPTDSNLNHQVSSKIEKESWIKENGTLEQFLIQNSEMKRLIDLVQSCRKRFRWDQKDTSADSKNPDCSHIFYFDAFKAQRIVLDKEHEIFIHPEFLARAFDRRDVYNIALELSSAIFNEYDLKRRNAHSTKVSLNSSVDRVEEELILTLSSEKRKCISRLTKWIFERQQCPWKISRVNVKTLAEFSAEEYDKDKDIRKAFLTFKTINEYHREEENAQVTDKNYAKWFDEVSIYVQMDKHCVDTDRTAENCVESLNHLHITNSPDSIDPETKLVSCIRRKEIIFFRKIFRKILAEIYKASPSPLPYTPVDLVRILTKLTVKSCEDVFSDAVQFSIQRWNKTKELVEQNKLVEAADNLFRKFWRLDFEWKEFNDLDNDFCPIKFLAITRAIAKLLAKDSEDDHDRFLDWDTIDKIKEFINNKYRGTMYTSTHQKNELSSLTDAELWEISMSLENANIFENLENVSFEEATPPVAYPQLLTIIEDPSAPASQSLSVVVESMVPVSQPELSGPPGSSIPSSQPSDTTANSSQQANAINYCVDARQNLIVYLCEITIRLKPEIWKKIYDLQKKPTVTVNVVRGKEVFSKLFTEDEKREGCYSGRKNKNKYNPYKIESVLAIIAVMKGWDRLNVKKDDLVNLSGSSDDKLSHEETKDVIKRVFQEEGNRQRGTGNVPTKRKRTD